MHPAPIPPKGIAICVALSPLKLRCGPSWKSSSDEYGSFPESGAGGLETGEDGGLSAKGAAAPKAAEDVATKNSLRVDLSKGDIGPPLENQRVPEPFLA
jgi:hypothetical protein